MSLTSMAVRAAYKGGKKAVKAQQARNAAAKVVDKTQYPTEVSPPRNSVLDSIKDSEDQNYKTVKSAATPHGWDGTWGLEGKR
jgi:hypothetical protein